MTKHPDFRDLVGDDLAPDEEARLRRVHDLLLQAGPPAELPPQLAEGPPVRGAKVIGLPRRRLGAALVLAAALAAAAFGGGYAVGHHGSGFDAVGAPIPMHGTNAAQFASIQVGSPDGAGNWPIVLRVRGLKPLARGGYYELYLAKGSTLGPSCGTFRVHADVTQVQLNAPASLRDWPDWVLVAHRPGASGETAPILRT